MIPHYPLDLPLTDLGGRIEAIRRAAVDSRPVSGATHGFYRYPARFSPQFAAAAIEAFSNRGDLIVDPFMGGGTAIVEATRLGRRAIGTDVNALAVFVSRVKTSVLRLSQSTALKTWADRTVPGLRYHDALAESLTPLSTAQTRNMHLPHARTLKKLSALVLESLTELPDPVTRRFARCALLRTGQWALNGRRMAIDCEQFRTRLQTSVHGMLEALSAYQDELAAGLCATPIVLQCDATHINIQRPFTEGERADLVITSPPYPGIHVLYHRWQVDGRKETAAPYWISGTRDGKGTAYYNLGDRRNREAADYFERLDTSFRSIRSVMKDGAVLVQMVAFSDPQRDLRRYVSTMRGAGFTEFPLAALSPDGRHRRLWRSVPNRAWHAATKGATASSREVVFLHTAS